MFLDRDANFDNMHASHYEMKHYIVYSFF